ncbi:MAG TPA: chemotaxis protein CheW [Gammaproteobacteria bacterium]|nr:chemotaxis protein CheW [Gammaproteobacteria bacterium]
MVDLTAAERRKNLSGGHGKDILHCLLIPLQEVRILLPNTAVAEVISYTTPESVENAPDWMLGNIRWRDEKVPLLSFERLSGIGKQEHATRRIAVLNTLNGNPSVPYIALPIQSIPQLRLIQESSIVVTEKDELIDVVAASIDFLGESVLIPDLDALEQKLLALNSI